MLELAAIIFLLFAFCIFPFAVIGGVLGLWVLGGVGMVVGALVGFVFQCIAMD